MSQSYSKKYNLTKYYVIHFLIYKIWEKRSIKIFTFWLFIRLIKTMFEMFKVFTFRHSLFKYCIFNHHLASWWHHLQTIMISRFSFFLSKNCWDPDLYYHLVWAQIQVFTLLFLLYDILTIMFNTHYILVKVISKQANVIVSHSHTLQVISKQAAVMVSHSHLLLFFGANPFTLALVFTLAI